MSFHRRRLAIDALIGLLAISGLALMVIGGRPPAEPPHHGSGTMPQGPPGPTASSRPPPADSAAIGGRQGVAPVGASPPVRLDIPVIGVSTSVMALGLNTDGTVAVPPLRADAPAGWYRHLATPGEVGPAVILGHVDSAQDGPAVFYRLHELRPGDAVTVGRADGSRTIFTISDVIEYPKSAFPAEAVYGRVGHPALRLVTCGGTFDRLRRQYRGNVVAYATLTATSAG